MIDALISRQWPAKVLRHDPSVFANSSDLWSHFPKQREVGVFNPAWPNLDVSVRRYISAIGLAGSLHPDSVSGTPQRYSAQSASPAKTCALNLLAKGANRIPPFFTANRASYFSARTKSFVESLHLYVIKVYRRMYRKVSEVARSRHILSPTLLINSSTL
jgi:hypothetical protein